jgi:hypothetical protein
MTAPVAQHGPRIRGRWPDGCGGRFQLNHSWPEIVSRGGAALAETYNELTGKITAWVDFETVINSHFPVGKTYRLKTDNLFPV